MLSHHITTLRESEPYTTMGANSSKNADEMEFNAAVELFRRGWHMIDENELDAVYGAYLGLMSLRFNWPPRDPKNLDHINHHIQLHKLPPLTSETVSEWEEAWMASEKFNTDLINSIFHYKR